MDKRVTGPDKSELRHAMKARRRELAADEKSAAGAVICEKLKARLDVGEMIDPFDFGSPLAVYLASQEEINIDPYIEYMLRAHVEVVAPRWNGETYELARLKGLDEKNMRRGPMGIREPVDADIVEPQKVFAWIIPGLAFTRGGKRLGYGGGWYDRLLVSAPKDAVKIGVAYSFQIVDDLPSEPHDIPLSDIVDDSLDDDALEFEETEYGFEAKIISKDKSRRVKTIAIYLLWTLLSLVIGFAVFSLLYALANSGMYMPSQRVVGITLLFVLAFFVISVAMLIKAIAVCVECDAEIHFANGEGVCHRRLFGRISLPVRRFTLSPWSRATGGMCDSKLEDADFDSVKIWADGEYVPPCRPLVKTYARTALMLAIQINRANTWDVAAYNAARRAYLANPPRGMNIHSTDDGQGRIAVIRPFSPNISLSDVGGVFFVLLLANFLLYIPYVGWVLGGIVAAATLSRCLFGIIRGLFGTVKCEIKNGQMNCTEGLWPFVRNYEFSLDGLEDKVRSSGGDGLWWHDLLERRDPFSWLPPKYVLPLRLFVEESITAKIPPQEKQ